jgi:Uncharacterized protein conserved in bacteria (DUF2213)
MKNAQILPQRFFGLHMLPGVAEYAEPGKEPYRIFIGEDAIRNMDPTFDGRPVYVFHVDQVNIDKLQTEADGYVVKSFYNAADGKHWVEFLVVSDKGHQAIKNGWRLSNAYIPKTFGSQGMWNGLSYDKEIMSGEYEHLAIVPNPRYDESIILTPEQFKEYCETKDLELKRLANSKQGEKTVLNFFKKTKVENAADLESMSVTLPKSKKEFTLSHIVNVVDDFEMDKGAPQMANMEHMVEMSDGENKKKMSVKNLMDCYHSAMSELEEMKKKNAELDGGEKQADKDKASSDKTENGSDLDGGEKEEQKEKKAADKTENEAEEDKPEQKKKNSNFDRLKNAPKVASMQDPIQLDLDKAARGRARYGSN